jgi:hypothetical protein
VKNAVVSCLVLACSSSLFGVPERCSDVLPRACIFGAPERCSGVLPCACIFGISRQRGDVLQLATFSQYGAPMLRRQYG